MGTLHGSDWMAGAMSTTSADNSSRAELTTDRYAPIGDYGAIGDLRATHTAQQCGDREILFVGRSGTDELALRLRSSIPMQLADGAAVARFTLHADESAWFVFEVVRANEPSPCARSDHATEAFKETVNFWRRRIGPQHLQEPLARDGESFRARAEAAHVQGHGSIIAAPTFGLPETIGGTGRRS